MANIDPNIALGVKPLQIENPMNQYAAMSQIESNQQANQLNALKMQQAQQEIADVNALRGKDINDPNFISEVGKINPKLAFDYQTKQGAIIKDRIAAQESKIKLLSQMKRDISGRPSDANIIALTEDLKFSGLFSPQEVAAAEATQARLLAMSEPERKAFLASQGASASDLKPVIQNTNLGGTELTRAFDPYSGAATEISNIKKTMTPGELAVDARAKENQKLQYGEDVVANTVTDAAGNVTQFNRFGKVIGTPGAVGKPSATFEKTQALQKQLGTNLDTAIREISDAIKPGGVLEKATGSGAGKLKDTTAGFFGIATEGAINSAKLKPVADLALKVIPRFEGPQSDKDTASYKEAAGQLGNELLPIEIRRAAGETVVRLMRERKNQFRTQEMETEGLGTSANKPPPPSGFVPDKTP